MAGIGTAGRRLLTVVAASVALLVGTAGLAAGAQDDSVLYVALGDSYTSGPFIPVQRADPPGAAARNATTRRWSLARRAGAARRQLQRRHDGRPVRPPVDPGRGQHAPARGGGHDRRRRHRGDRRQRHRLLRHRRGLRGRGAPGAAVPGKVRRPGGRPGHASDRGGGAQGGGRAGRDPPAGAVGPRVPGGATRPSSPSRARAAGRSCPSLPRTCPTSGTRRRS